MQEGVLSEEGSEGGREYGEVDGGLGAGVRATQRVFEEGMCDDPINDL